jgi:hypothetical protein
VVGAVVADSIRQRASPVAGKASSRRQASPVASKTSSSPHQTPSPPAAAGGRGRSPQSAQARRARRSGSQDSVRTHTLPPSHDSTPQPNPDLSRVKLSATEPGSPGSAASPASSGASPETDAGARRPAGPAEWAVLGGLTEPWRMAGDDAAAPPPPAPDAGATAGCGSVGARRSREARRWLLAVGPAIPLLAAGLLLGFVTDSGPLEHEYGCDGRYSDSLQRLALDGCGGPLCHFCAESRTDPIIFDANRCSVRR